MPNIIIRGYYGFGNLGDDVLMIVTFRWLKKSFPGHSILICADSRNFEYISSLLGGDVVIIQSDSRIDAEWIIYGGGGIFFDFNESGKIYGLVNTLIKMIGYTPYKKIYNAYRSIKSTTGISAKKYAGLGLGVGSYTKTSKRFYADILPLSSFDFLLVRDEESASNLEHHSLTFPVAVASDLAFISDYWKGMLRERQKLDELHIGFILRDWPNDNHAYMNAVEKVVEQLNKRNYVVNFYSFDSRSDSFYVKKFSTWSPVAVWDPYKLSLHDFLSKLSVNNLVITSRAHGAILSACMGIPSVCLAIEPKLRHVSTMLSKSSVLVDNLFDAGKILQAIDQQIHAIDQSSKLVKEDVDNNLSKIMNGLANFEEFAKSIPSE
jgi:polysaccharide pyruvyl transferase WcaK-like protein